MHHFQDVLRVTAFEIFQHPTLPTAATAEIREVLLLVLWLKAAWLVHDAALLMRIRRVEATSSTRHMTNIEGLSRDVNASSKRSNYVVRKDKTGNINFFTGWLGNSPEIVLVGLII